MKKISQCLLFAIGMMLLSVSCSQETPKSESMEKPDMADPLYQKVNAYYNIVHQNESNLTKSDGAEIKITGVQTSRYDLEGNLIDDSDGATRSGEAEDSFTISTLDLDFGETQGYAILSDDPRIDRMFFYTENGSPNDSCMIPGLKMVMETYPQVAADILAETKKSGVTRAAVGETTETIPNFVRFTWGQEKPYNACAPYCDCAACSKRGNHQLAGCVTVAVAQYLAARGVFNGTYYPNRNVDFSTFPEDIKIWTAAQEACVVALFREVAHNCQIQFGCIGTSGHYSAVVNYLNEIGIPASESSDFYPSKVKAQFQKGIPFIIRGNDGSTGHMWLLTGMVSHYDANGVIQSYDYYCNWGWDGRSNGWSVGNAFCPRPYYNITYKPFWNGVHCIYTTLW